MTKEQHDAEQKKIAQENIRRSLAMAMSSNPHMMILGYMTENNDLAVIKFCRDQFTEAMLYLCIQTTVIEQARKNFIKDSGDFPVDTSKMN